MSAPARLHPDDVQAIAEAVVALLREQPARDKSAEQPALVDAAAVARALGVHRDTVYEHAELLGARRLGSGPRARLRFDLQEALDAWTLRLANESSSGSVSPAAPPFAPPSRPRRSSTALDAVPVRELQPRRIPSNRGGAAATARPTAQEE